MRLLAAVRLHVAVSLDDIMPTPISKPSSSNVGAPSAVAAFEKAKTQQLSISKGNSPKQRSPKGSPRPKKSAVTSARSAAANTADGQKSGRKSAEQLKALNDEFKKTAATPEESTIDALAITIGLSAKDVRLWFHRKVQQQRNKAKQNGIPKSGKSTSTNKNNESNDDAKTAAREPIAPARLATVIAEISEKYGVSHHESCD